MEGHIRVEKSTGSHYQTQPRHVQDSYIVEAHRGAEDSENVSRQHFSELSFAIVVECVLRTNISFSRKPVKALLG